MNNGSQLADPTVKRLNLGAGKLPVPGFIDIDKKNGSEVYPLPYDDNSIAEIRASHILEHFPYEKALDVVKEWVRVLKPGGLIKIAVPDFEWIAREYLEGKDVDAQRYIMGGHMDENDRHGAIFDDEVLTAVMQEAGLAEIQKWESDVKDCASLPCSLNLQGRKPAKSVASKPSVRIRVKCAMSVPRLGFQDNFFCWATALLPFGIKPTKYDGAFWGQCLERVMSEMLDSDFILTVDYDSVFDKATVEKLFRLAVEYPDGDAFVSVQMKRASEHPLLTIMGENGQLLKHIKIDEFQKEVTKIYTGHFGLTLIRTESLKKLPHPWFLGVPNDQGQWGEGRIDDDIYFWHKMHECGMTVYSANRCVVGHGQFLVTWPSTDFQLIHQNPSEFWAEGHPKDVWK